MNKLPIKCPLQPAIIHLCGRTLIAGGSQLLDVSDCDTPVSISSVHEFMAVGKRWKSKGDDKQSKFKRSWTVRGSKGDIYTIKYEYTRWSCNCIGFGFYKRCKHMRAIKNKFGDEVM